ncbi:MAG: riboflavin kinase/FMN adenylyltransferase [Bacteroidetes bacterium]|nr:MAG: riboflavin kinase/FMN adenylyltransferase [Bacteroidota bacterium]
MKVYNSIDEFVKTGCPVVTTGTFDGVHTGHLQIIRRLKETAQRCNGETVLLTFFPHPRMVLFPDRKQLLLSSQDEKIELLRAAGIDHLVIHPFTREFSMLTSQEFIRKILVEKLGTKKLVIGHDHHFGRNREGSFEHLREFGPVYGFDVEEIPAHEVEHVNVSSTRIRKALETCDVSDAARLLGYYYRLSGTVVKGNQLGRTIGYPTANIRVNDPDKLSPANGIYAVIVKYRDKKYGGMLSIGVRPTIGEGLERTTEVNIFNFDKDIYGESLTVEFVKYLRPEEKYPSLELLQKQLAADKLDSIEALKNENLETV